MGSNLRMCQVYIPGWCIAQYTSGYIPRVVYSPVYPRVYIPRVVYSPVSLG